MEKIWAALGSLAIVGSIAGYVLERDRFQNTIEVEKLIFGALGVGFLAAAFLIFLMRKKLATWPERAAIGLLILGFSPLAAEFSNRILAEKGGHETFVFEREEARFASLGLQKGEPFRPNQFILRVKKGGKNFTFKHRNHALFPLTRAGEDVLLPIEKGKLGFALVVLD